MKSRLMQELKATVAKFNKLDVVISNAGIQTIAPIVDFETSAWKRLIDIHLHGTFLLLC